MKSFEEIQIYKALFDRNISGMMLVNSIGLISLYNKAAGKLTGKSLQSVLGKRLITIFPDLWNSIKPIIEAKKSFDAIFLKLTKNKSVIIHSSAINSNSFSGAICLFQEPSTYEHILKNLPSYRTLTEHLDVLFDTSFDGLWLCDHKGLVIRINKASEKLMGVAAAQVIGRHVQDLVKEGLFDKSVTTEVLKKRSTVTLFQQVKNGKQVLVTGNPVFDNKGKIQFVVTNTRDMSKLNELKSELEESRKLTRQYRSELKQLYQHQALSKKVIIRSTTMQRAFDKAMKAACVDSTVLISGESGVGKGFLAKLIHEASNRQSVPVIKVDCGAIPESLVEAELFGYEKGAFTGARDKGKSGYFELAEGGTLFLDEVGELPVNVQAKLLRFLDDNEVVRIGSTIPRKIDVRIIAATNRNLQEMVKAGTFRKDLFFRLNVIPIHIPMLKNRKDDIPPLIHHFLNQFNRKCGVNKTISTPALNILCKYSFPGNIREIANLVEQLVVLTPGEVIGPEDIPDTVKEERIAQIPYDSNQKWPLRKVVEHVEKNVITNAINLHKSQRKAAKALGIDHSTLSRKKIKYNI